jgi:HEAT repeat protein
MQTEVMKQLRTVVVVLGVLGWGAAGIAQQSATPQTQPKQENPGAQIVGETGSEEPDEPAAAAPDVKKTTAAGGNDAAWKMLEDGLANNKPQIRIDAVSAIGTMGATGRSRALIEKALKDKERDVRLAAVIALGISKNRSVIPLLQDTLDNDGAPEVGFAAATALWKMHDHSGEDVLYGVLSGQLKTHQGVVGSEMHQASRDLHDPAVLAKIGAEQGAYALLGPFGIGLDAARMVYKGPNANSARVLTATLLADDKSLATAREFISTLHDKDYFVRGASARALGDYHGKEVRDALLETFGDRKPAVRFMAAASYIRVSSGAAKTTKPAAAKAPAATNPGE